MKGIVMPEKTEDFTADPVELFFDLGFVLAFSQLVGVLVHHPDWRHVGECALLIWLMWMPWSQFTWSANAVSGNGRAVRLIFLVGTAASIPMAASVSTAFDGGGPIFSVSLGVIYALALATMALGIERGSAVHESLVPLASLSGLAIAVTVAGGFVDGDGRIAVWLLGSVFVVAALVRAGKGDWVVRSGHFAERHGLIVIIALGEVIVAIGAPVVDQLEEGGGLPGATVVALVGAGVFAGVLWWSYFDRPSPSLEHRAEAIEGDQERGRFARDVYTLSHLPIVAGIILAAAGLEEIALHPDEAVPVAFLAMLGGGLGLALLGVSTGVWRAFRVFARERVAALALIVAVLVVADSAELAGAWVIVAVDLLLIAFLWVEHVRIEIAPNRADVAAAPPGEGEPATAS